MELVALAKHLANFKSDEEDSNCDEIDETSLKIPKRRPMITNMKYENFFHIIKLYPCLFNKSQMPENKTIKQHALQEIKAKIENAHGINLSGSQIRKKLENMKMRAKSKRDKIQMGDLSTKLKYFEHELLKLMDYKKYSFAKSTDPEQCDLSADSSKYFKYEAEDELSQDEDEQIKSNPPSVPLEIIPGLEIKSETNESLQFEQLAELNSKDTDSFISEEDHLEKTEEKSTKSGFGIKEKDFFDIIKFHGCLFEKSQAPHVKTIKQEALLAIKEKIKSIHGINMNSSQIRKKIDNMKGRVKGKLDKSIRRNSPRYKLKSHEKQLLNLMKFKALSDAELCRGTYSSEDSNDALYEKERTPMTLSFSNCINSSIPISSENNQFDKLSVFSMQKEVLVEQKELNRQQNELNALQKEILTLKKEKLLLEIDLLKKKQNKV